MECRRSSAKRKPALEIDATPERAEADWIKEGEEAVSPTGRLFREPHFRVNIVSVFGFGAPIDLSAMRAGLQASLARHPRFCSVQVLNELEEDPRPKWVRTTVNIDDHIIVPELDATATSLDPDKALEDYVSSLSTLPMDHTRPLWELHILDFPTSEAAAAVVIRAHHSLGDGVSLVSLFIACTRRASDQTTLPALPTTTARGAGPVYALLSRPRLSPSRGALAAFAAWVMSLIVLLWHTVLDVACFVMTAMSISVDLQTVFKGAKGVEFRPKRFVNRTLSLEDVKFVKNTMNCTVNDVLLGVTSAALSRYYFRKTGYGQREQPAVSQSVAMAGWCGASQGTQGCDADARRGKGHYWRALMMQTGADCQRRANPHRDRCC
ncbi:hypothetical protein QYE76_049050 [Lolium multiflorum]|uniref:diacylglycerol O-acyltransferase n=1 Tax=Lolium multiflorum TaxID=4521 RepID=A0AAD8SP89_LOLMU|nr:hypothetical protein QYE76_049050 [Lolium multiflorum]